MQDRTFTHRRKSIGILIRWILLLGIPSAVWAHGGNHSGGVGWNSIVLIWTNLTAISLLYAIGCYRRRQHSGRIAIPRWRLICFAGAVSTLLLALVSPVNTLAEKLGWVHMIQHTVLMMISAPLFIAASPGGGILWAFPVSWRARLWRVKRKTRSWRLPHYSISQPIIIWLIFAVTLWIWHIPVLYEGALQSRFIHDLQHLSFFLTACLFWQALFHPLRRRRLNQGLGVLYLFLTSIHSTALGVLMAFSPVVWYPYYENTAPALGYSALEDQQIAGYIMWMPACMLYSAIAIALFAAWIRDLRDPMPAQIMEPVKAS